MATTNATLKTNIIVCFEIKNIITKVMQIMILFFKITIITVMPETSLKIMLHSKNAVLYSFSKVMQGFKKPLSSFSLYMYSR